MKKNTEVIERNTITIHNLYHKPMSLVTIKWDFPLQVWANEVPKDIAELIEENRYIKKEYIFIK